MSIALHSAAKVDARGAVDDFWMLVEGERIVRTGTGAPPPADEAIDLGGAVLAPGFIDLHVHGGGGYAFDDGSEAAQAALAVHRAHGTTRSLLSLVANPIASLESSLAVVAELVESDPLVLGAHLEGPFLAASRRGAHAEAFLRTPDAATASSLIAAARGTLRLVTIAPELDGSAEAIAAFRDAGAVVAVGHTEADLDTASAAFDAGARVLTHAFNAMPGIHHRAPGPVVAAIRDARVVLELILDGEHVHPDVAALAFASAPGRIALVTDAMSAAGCADGDYRLGELDVSVADGRAVVAGTETLAGSTLTLDAALRFAVERVGVPLDAAVAAVTATPARVLGLESEVGMLAPGFAADAVVLDDSLRVLRVWAAGREIRG